MQIHWALQLVMFIGLILAKFWTIKVISPLMFLIKLRIYFGIFQTNSIMIKADNSVLEFFSMMVMLITLLFHIAFIGKIIMFKAKRRTYISYYIANGLIIFFGMFYKIIGFEEAWKIRSKLYTLIFFTMAGFALCGYIMNGVNNCEIQELKYDQKKLRMMELKDISAKEIKSIVKSLQEGILVIQNEKTIYENKNSHKFMKIDDKNLNCDKLDIKMFKIVQQENKGQTQKVNLSEEEYSMNQLLSEGKEFLKNKIFTTNT